MPKITPEELAWFERIRRNRKHPGKSLKLQDKSCNQYQHIEDIVKCKPCQEPEPLEENCVFKDFRAFRLLKKQLMFGFYFPKADQQRSPLSHSSKRFSQNKLYSSADRIYLKSKLRKVLKDTFANDQPVHHFRTKSHEALLRKGFEGYRHVCDICLTSIFNNHYFCPVCAIDICLICYNNWKNVKKDPTKTACHAGMNHSRQIFILSKKYSDQDIDVVMEELEDESDEKMINSIREEPGVEGLSELNAIKPDPSLLPLTPNSDDQHVDGLDYNPIIMIKERSGSFPVKNKGDGESRHSLLSSGAINNTNNSTASKHNIYPHLDGVITNEATDRSLPTTIADAISMTTKTFQEIWKDKNPLLVENCLENSTVSWNPKSFGEAYGSQEIEVIDCKDNSKHVSTAKEFFDSYESEEKLAAYCEKMGTSKVIKIKDWPPKDDFKEVFKDLHNDYMNNVLPAKEYCSDNGYFNISNRLPEEYMPPDLGPKMFISQGADTKIHSRTKLHCDMADAVNVMCFSKTSSPAAKWEIFASKDLSRLREFVNKLNKAKNRNHGFDPILSESSFLDEKDLEQLQKETGIKPFQFFQKQGDAVFVPAGSAHQVQNISGSIKCAYDFLSPETMQESNLVTSHFQRIKLEDKLQLKTTVLYAWKTL